MPIPPEKARPSRYRKPPVVVLGMHRSGTSLVARLLDDLGVHMGRELEENHESVVVLGINNEILARAGSHWARPEPIRRSLRSPEFSDQCTDLVARRWDRESRSHGYPAPGRAWGFKDPRLALTWPVWEPLFPEARVVHVVRNGIDVATSLCRRELRRYTHRVVEKRMWPGPGTCYRLWETYLTSGRSSLDAHRGPSLTVRYEELLASPREVLHRITDFASLPKEDLEAACARVRAPSPHRSWIAKWLRLLERTGRLDFELLESLGYPPP